MLQKAGFEHITQVQRPVKTGQNSMTAYMSYLVSLTQRQKSRVVFVSGWG